MAGESHTVRSRISVDPKVMFGKPVIRGTRIPVDIILRKLASGHSFQTVLQDYPRLTAEDIEAALAYAAEAVNGIEFAEVPGTAP